MHDHPPRPRRRTPRPLGKPTELVPWVRATFVALFLALSFSPATRAAAETAHVKLPNTPLLAGKSAATARLAQLARGDALTVTAREGTWLKVRAANNKEGYVHITRTDLDAVGPADTARNTSSAAGRTVATAAGKGVGESAAAWASAQGQSTAGLDRMLTLRAQLTGEEYESFTTTGHVGPAKSQ